MTLSKGAFTAIVIVAVALLIVYNQSHWFEILVGATTIVMMNILGNILARDIEVTK
jgi:hypothetical protein